MPKFFAIYGRRREAGGFSKRLAASSISQVLLK
jgi:hypothetical protein